MSCYIHWGTVRRLRALEKENDKPVERRIFCNGRLIGMKVNGCRMSMQEYYDWKDSAKERK